jgi:hypothetical protein
MGTKLHQFHMDKTASRFVFSNGKVALFEGGIYRTTSDAEADELKREIASGIGAIWQTAGQEIVDSDEIDPVAVFKRKIIAEYEAERARSLDNGASESDTKRAQAAGSNVLGAVSAPGVAVIPGSIKAAGVAASATK